MTSYSISSSSQRAYDFSIYDSQFSFDDDYRYRAYLSILHFLFDRVVCRNTKCESDQLEQHSVLAILSNGGCAYSFMEYFKSHPNRLRDKDTSLKMSAT